MEFFLDIITIILLFTVFAFFHSFLASLKFKTFIKEKLGNLIAFYRLVYNLFSLFTFSLVLYYMPKLHHIVYEIPSPFDLFVYVLQIISLFFLIWSLKFVDLKEFIGLSQIIRYFQKKFNETFDEKYILRVDGPYKISRHPIYLFTILFLILRPYMTLSYLIFITLVIIYFYIGSYFEEKKLEQIFGQEYIKYKSQVSRIFPIKWIVKAL